MSRTTSALLIAPMLTLGALVLTGGPALAAPAAAASSSTTTLAAVPASSGTITIKNFAYQGPGTVAPGAKITVTNQDSEAHTVTADTGGAFNVTVPAGGSATFTAPTAPGSYAFHCNFHGNMHGSLVVQSAASSAPAPSAPASQAPAAAPSSAPMGSQMSQMPVGAPATGANNTSDPAGTDLALVAEGTFLVLAAGGVYALRRRMTNQA